MIFPSSSTELLCTAGTIVIERPSDPQRAARIHAGDVLQSLRPEPHRDLVRRRGLRAARASDRDRVGRVIAVAVGDQDQIEGAELFADSGDLGLPVIHGRRTDALAAGRLNEKRRAAGPGD